jgi:alpha-galactosidase
MRTPRYDGRATMGGSVKIGIIGAGSAQFSLGVVRDLCLTPALAGSEICFMDIDQQRLEAVDRLARRYAAELQVDLRFTSTRDRARALADADFVLNTAARPHADEEQERATWERFGYYRGVRVPYLNLELMLDIARDVERICPRAWLLQVSNPVFEICTLLGRQTKAKVIGLCHGYTMYHDIARVLDLDTTQIAFEAPGVNHCIWMTQFRYRGENAYPLIDAWIEHEAERYWSQPPLRYSDTQMSRASVDMYRMYGLFPLGDTTRFGGSQYVSQWWMHTDFETKSYWYGEGGGFDSETGWGRYLDKLNDNVDVLLRTAYDDGARVTEVLPPQHGKDQFAPIIDALANDRQGTFQVNVLNQGLIPGIADDVAVELSAVVNANGVQPIRPEPLARKLLNHVLVPKILEMELNLEVFQSGDARAWLHQLLLDHRTRTPEQAATALESVLDLPWNSRLRDRFGDVRELLPTTTTRELVAARR